MKLKNCPFCTPSQTIIEGFDSTAKCNNADIIGLGSSYYWGKCTNCGATGSGRPTKEDAVAVWNTRPVEKELLVALKECYEQLRKSCNEKEIACARSCDKCVLQKAKKIIEPVIEKYEVKR